MAPTPYIVTKGIVLRESETKEADKIMTLLTQDRGKIPVIARGVRRKGCKYAACAQSLVYSEWTLYQKGDWYYANEGTTVELFGGLRKDLDAMALGFYFAEMTEAVVTEETPSQGILRHRPQIFHGVNFHRVRFRFRFGSRSRGNQIQQKKEKKQNASNFSHRVHLQNTGSTIADSARWVKHAKPSRRNPPGGQLFSSGYCYFR